MNVYVCAYIYACVCVYVCSLLIPLFRIHIRRTDKLSREARYIHLEKYMERVKLFYQELALTQQLTERRVFLATDDSRVIGEFKEKSVE